MELLKSLPDGCPGQCLAPLSPAMALPEPFAKELAGSSFHEAGGCQGRMPASKLRGGWSPTSWAPWKPEPPADCRWKVCRASAVGTAAGRLTAVSTWLPSVSSVLQIFHLGLGRTVCACKSYRSQGSGIRPTSSSSSGWGGLCCGSHLCPSCHLWSVFTGACHSGNSWVYWEPGQPQAM